MEDYLLKHVSVRRYLTDEEPKKKRKSGFQKGCIPHNKGITWDKYISQEKREKILRILKEQSKVSPGTFKKGLVPDNAIPVVAFKDGRKVGSYRSASEAGRALGITPECIRRCLAGKRRSSGGYIFYRRDDREAWLNVLYTHEDAPAGFHWTKSGRLYPDKTKKTKKA